MISQETVIRYKTAMAEFKRWHMVMAISDADLLTLSTAVGKRYGLSLFSIFIEKDLLCKENRVIYSTEKGELHGKNYHTN